EDGIRDRTVTGVQTCALPISRAFDNIYQHFDELSDHFLQPDAWSILANLIYWSVLILIAVAKALSLAVIAFGLIASAVCGLLGRSEERRVGKEGRAAWWAEQA